MKEVELYQMVQDKINKNSDYCNKSCYETCEYLEEPESDSFYGCNLFGDIIMNFYTFSAMLPYSLGDKFIPKLEKCLKMFPNDENNT